MKKQYMTRYQFDNHDCDQFSGEDGCKICAEWDMQGRTERCFLCDKEIGSKSTSYAVGNLVECWECRNDEKQPQDADNALTEAYEDYTDDYPIGSLIEPYDIEIEKELTR
ncbi:MAG: hypothetical protein KGI50_06400 [Patescibacteria group bacterium]|nr:hypothetical protein [Patescibacteria group bacterium]MDE2439278.1 hypothetical protein [Patescibacteria group bacterium]